MICVGHDRRILCLASAQTLMVMTSFHKAMIRRLVMGALNQDPSIWNTRQQSLRMRIRRVTLICRHDPSRGYLFFFNAWGAIRR